MGWTFLVPRCKSLLALPPDITVINRLLPPSTQRLTVPKAFRHSSHLWYRNIDRLSIAYAFQPRLRPD